MPRYNQDDEQISDGVNLLISILVRYPEIGTINFNPQTNSLKLTFMIAKIPTADEFNNLRNLLLDSIQAYWILEGLIGTISNVELSSYEQVAMLNVLRDVATFSKGEIALIISILRNNFKERLVTDNNDSMLEEDLLMQEELIDNMLQNIKHQKTLNGLIGIREDGRVLVFNK